MRLLRPSASLLISVAPPLAHAVTVGAVNLRAATALNSQLASSTQALQAFAENPIVPLALEDFTQTLLVGNPVARRARARAGQLQLLHAGVPQPGEPHLREHRPRHAVAGVDSCSPPPDPTTRASPPRRPPTGRRSNTPSSSSAIIDNNHLHANPYPNVTGPGQPPNNCEAGNETYLAGKAVIEQRARSHRHRARTDESRTEPVRRKVSELDARESRPGAGQARGRADESSALVAPLRPDARRRAGSDQPRRGSGPS